MERSVVLFFLFFFSCGVFADATSFISEEMERIVQVKIQGNIILSDAMVAFEKNGRLFLPLNDFFESTGIAIDVGGEQLLGQGFVVEESNTVRINFAECFVEMKDASKNFDCNDYFETAEGIYGSVKFLETFLPMKIYFDSLSSTVNIDALRTLPPVAKMLRDRKSVNRKEELDDEQVYSSERKWFDGVNFDQDISTRYSKNSTTRKSKIDVLHQTSLSAELLKGEFYSSYTGVNNKKESSWLSLERNDYRSRIFGDVGLSEVKIYNFNTNSLKLIGGSRTLQGLYLSNRPLNVANRFSTQDFSGSLDNGWEVELYHNDVLIGREIGSLEKQRYEFKEVDLYYGVNSFHFIFYGPKGEVKHRYQDFNIENMFQKTKRPTISLAIGKDDKNKDYRYAEIDYLLFDRLFVEVLQTQFYDKKQRKYSGLNLSTFLGGTIVGFHNAFDEKNTAQELSLKFNFLNINSNISYVLTNGLTSELINKEGNVKSIKKGTFLLPIPFVSNMQLFIDLKENDFESDRKMEERYRLSLSFSQLYLSSTFERTEGNRNYEFFSRYNWNKNQIRFTTHANNSGPQDFNLDFSFRNNKGSSLGIGTSYTMNSDTESLNIRYDRLFNSFSLGVSGSVDDKNNSQLFLNVSYGSVVDKDMGILLFNKKTSEYGNAKIVAFIDKNNNNLLDEDEDVLPNVEFRKLAGNQVVVSDENGRAFFSMLQPHRATDFKVSMKNIDNIFLRPKEDGLRLWPRAGKTSEVYFPLSIRGEVEGEIDFGKFENSKRVEGFIENENGFKKFFEVDSDGYFLVDNVPAGSYDLVIKCITCNDKVVRKEFLMPKEGDTVYVDGLSF